MHQLHCLIEKGNDSEQTKDQLLQDTAFDALQSLELKESDGADEKTAEIIENCFSNRKQRVKTGGSILAGKQSQEELLKDPS